MAMLSMATRLTRMYADVMIVAAHNNMRVAIMVMMTMRLRGCCSAL